MFVRPARILLAISSEQSRSRLRSLLTDDPSVQVVAEADSGHAVAARIAEVDVDTIICDAHIVGDPSMDAMFAPHSWKLPCKVVLVTVNALATPYRGAIPITAVLSLDIPTDELSLRLRAAVKQPMNSGKLRSMRDANAGFIVPTADSAADVVGYQRVYVSSQGSSGFGLTPRQARIIRQEQRRQ